MRKIFSTKELHARDRFDCWHEVACKEIVINTARPKFRPGFHAELEGESLGDIGILNYEISPMEVVRTKRHIASANSDDVIFFYQIAGSSLLEQGGREVMLNAGEMALHDPMLPHTSKFPTSSKVLLFQVPRVSLEARVGKVGEFTAIAMRRDKAEHALSSSFLTMLPAYAGQMSAATQALIQEQALDLMALSLAKTYEGRPRLSSGSALVLMNLRAAVDARLADPTLDVKTVAAAAGVSVRYANSLLARENTSLVHLIRTRRLARCLKALKDPLQAHRTVSEIAYGWGFSDMTHFGRVFKKAYGVLPSEYGMRSTRTGSR